MANPQFIYFIIGWLCPFFLSWVATSSSTLWVLLCMANRALLCYLSCILAVKCPVLTWFRTAAGNTWNALELRGGP